MSGVKKLFTDRVLGVMFIALLAFMLWLVVSIFGQKFTSFDKVALKTDTVGLQLPNRADVKLRGVIVGQVLDMKPGSGPDQAVVTLGLKPDMMKSIPANVSAAILPKTLFGEKFISLTIPDDPSSASLQAGATITRTKLPIEVERVLNDIYPLLRTVQPAELNYTLNALATALEGRGDKLGQTLVTLDSYLKRFNPQVPALVDDLKLLANVSDTYADVFPQIATTLRNTITTTTTLEGREKKLRAFLRDATSFSDTATGFIKDNGDNLIRLGQVTEPQAALLARYSPTFPCMLKGIVNQIPLLASTFRGYVFHINLKTLPRQPRGYTPADRQVYGAKNAPNCAGLPNPPKPYPPAPNFDDGVNGLGRGDGQRVTPSTSAAGTRAAVPSIPTGVAATADQKAMINALTGPLLGQAPSDVPDLATMLFAPMAAGTEVSVR